MFWRFWGIFGDKYMRRFSQRISKIDENKEFGRFDVVLKFEFEGRHSPNGCLPTWVAPSEAIKRLAVFQIFIFYLNSGRLPP